MPRVEFTAATVRAAIRRAGLGGHMRCYFCKQYRAYGVTTLRDRRTGELRTYRHIDTGNREVEHFYFCDVCAEPIRAKLAQRRALRELPGPNVRRFIDRHADRVSYAQGGLL